MLHKNSYFLEPANSKNEIKVELKLCNYATKFDLKNATDLDTSDSAKTVELAGLKLNVEKLEVDKLNTVPIALRKLSDAVDKNFC